MVSNKKLFDQFYEVLYEGKKTQLRGAYQYFSLYLLRKMLFAFIVYHFHELHWALFQVICNMLLSFLFAVYLIHMRPFLAPEENKIQILNETCFLMVSILYFCFTDFNPDPLVKVYCGWVLILIVIVNLIYPNFWTMINDIGPSIT
jgi:hypothetical protein